jgi:hypothetical protein
MRTISSLDANNRFGQRLVAAQRAPVTVDWELGDAHREFRSRSQGSSGHAHSEGLAATAGKSVHDDEQMSAARVELPVCDHGRGPRGSGGA